MSDQIPTPETDPTDDVQGHAATSKHFIEDDVEGHGARPTHIVADSDDVEGHMPFRRGIVDDGESDDDKNPGARPRI